MDQATATKILSAGKNCLVTGKAGTGKSFMLEQHLKSLRKQYVPFACTASTGIAARNINGQTIHSWAGLGLGRKTLPTGMESRVAFFMRIRNNDYFSNVVAPRIRHAEVLVLDEISMITGEFLGDMEYVIRNTRTDYLDQPWGGMQVILVGDFLQLPPVEKGDTIDWAFKADCWDFQTLHLTKSYRQADPKWIQVLDETRIGQIGPESDALLIDREQGSYPEDSFGGSLLLSHNYQVDEVNSRELEALPGDMKSFKGLTSGSEAKIKALLDSLLTPENLHLKIGAKVIATANSSELGYCNGSIGFVIDFKPDKIVVDFEEEGVIEISKVEWDDSHRNTTNTKATFKQFPLKLAWAMSIHKSQSLSMSKIFVDAKRIFAPGQLYVALSRCRTLEGVHLINYDKKKAWCNKEAKAFYENLPEDPKVEEKVTPDGESVGDDDIPF